MEHQAVDDDICILKHETADTAAGESPVSVCAGDESVASHFALVTAYEDIKKRLRETEQDNTFLRKRVKQLEDKKKEKSESERLLTEQLQSKELELLQLRTEMETSQVMKSLNSPQDSWQMDCVSAQRKILQLQEELDRLSLKHSEQLEMRGDELCDLNGPNSEHNPRERSMQQAYETLHSEIARLRSELRHQRGLIRRLRPLISDTRRAGPIQCLQETESNRRAVVQAPLPQPPPALPSCSGRPCPPPAGGQTSALLPDILREDCWCNGPWPTQQCSGEALARNEASSVVLPPPPLNQASIDDSSRSFPSPPKPSDALFWELHSAASNSSSLNGNCSPRSPPNTESIKRF
ncbi:5-azacytidine-induced protein 2 isoform X3 [Syngnathus acus]|uniref:5-azacytidine-induced protein 2 isoform X3 n=1 Tax=Syngnathus acus TaxID=161584 RepID=UPI0018864273|nr:5-azacytidine-induced protein 2 isoform X3 [Syngnathus acus]